MFEYIKLKIKEPQKPTWLFHNFAKSNRILDGRRVKFKDGSFGNYQIKHPMYSNWFDIPSDLVQVVFELE